METHDVAKKIGVKNANLSHITSFGNYLLAQSFGYDNEGNYNSYLIRYNEFYNIKTKIEGNGKIKIKEDALEGETVSFELLPDDDNEVDKVEVLNGSENILITNNSFIMPNSDVIVNVVFKEKQTTIVKEEKYICTEKNDKYFDSNGNEVDKETYYQSCGVVDNPKTGFYLPPLLILAIFVIILIKKKNIIKKI